MPVKTKEAIKTALVEAVEWILAVCPEDFEAWAWVEDPDLEQLDAEPDAHESAIHAWGYLRGFADAHDVSVRELLGLYDIDLTTFGLGRG